ncbi:uncharacterized protein LOC123321798 [Coccinella septempunctata]|uniref:uncharacterized protein LOC123321798 n=1 Tax=Coccinella septempunctata TaxID=41139 RepID=UPI001D08DC5F|nr:uncharacterized protein LOC123321798 [Coccinella septempunctata]XP_044765511.1 uncharacterized protein LOC123321798 [Coccinella septempunctata]
MTSEGGIKKYASFLNECSQEMRNVFLKIGLGIMQSTQERWKVLNKVSQEFNIEKSKLVEIISAYVEIVKLFLITSDKEFNGLMGQFGFSPVFINQLPLIPNRKEVESTIGKTHNIKRGNLKSLKWRIDLSLSNEFVNKNAKSIIIQVNLSNGEKTTIKVDIKMFHRLRYNISLILRELAFLKD